ncbi:hypothetical protein [Streptomyces sp. SMS_SU21]|uniref:hypothetical protein n=1 Tax=Streptomyces sp. SMS_SU21 TaxID=2069440 RepID=UPI000C88EB19|nr:hypothetical protein [Streptomyces sp. SMS_SU21]MCA2201156.1 hypothetical protein [Streptomyces sp. SMS_SU21]
MAAVVAAVSLAVTAWGTYKAAQVADAQLTQSQESSEAETRSQASQVSMWSEGRYTDENRILVVSNRSADPIYAFLIVDVPGSDKFMLVGDVPPCTRVDISKAAMELPAKRLGLLGNYAYSLGFYDAEGRLWLRPVIGELERARKPFEGPDIAISLDDKPTAEEPMIRQPEVKTAPAPNCGTAEPTK